MAKHGRTLFIHIGPAKTGTSAIQHVLSAHPGTTPIYPRAGRWWDGAHHDLVFNFYKDFSRPDATRANIEALFEQIGKETRASPANILISSEAFWGRDVDAFIRMLLPHLEGINNVEVLATCREHLALSASIYNQLVKDSFFSERRSPDDFLIQEAPALTYARTLEALGNGTHPLRLLNYHPMETFVSRFLRQVGFNAPQDGVGMHNASLSTKGMIATLGVNHVAVAADEQQFLYRALEVLPGFLGPSGKIFTADAAAIANRVFQEDRCTLLESHRIALPSPPAMPSRSEFGLCSREIDEMANVLKPFGEKGEAATAFVRRFIHENTP